MCAHVVYTACVQVNVLVTGIFPDCGLRYVTKIILLIDVSTPFYTLDVGSDYSRSCVQDYERKLLSKMKASVHIAVISHLNEIFQKI